MKIPKLAVFATLLLVFAVGAFGLSDEGEIFSIGKKFRIHSEILNENRTYWVSLPASYDDPNLGPENYPVIYVLDGKSAFFPVAGIVNFMADHESVNYQIPQAIVVGIDTMDRARVLTPSALKINPAEKESVNRIPNSGGGELFLEFLTKELFPKIEKDYRTLPYRVYIGHSLGGLTSTYMLLRHPGIFDGYLAIDPSLWWNGGKLVKDAPQILETFGTGKIQRYYLSVVDSTEDPGQMAYGKTIHQFGDTLAEHAPTYLKWKMEAIPDVDHSSIPLLSWYNGLLFVFQGYDLSHYGMMADPDSIETHFDTLAENTGLRMDPPQTIFWILAHYLTTPNRYPDPEKAMKVINMGLEYHPQSPYLHEKLGVAYEMIDEPKKALEAYQNALRLNPKNKNAEEKVRQLKK
jgi:predicted alpha/beta superfamily hydrolase